MEKLKKLIVIELLMILILSYTIPALAISEETTTTKTIYSLPSVANMSLTGTNRGNWHDRQNLGIYMKAGASFQIRQTNTKFNKDLSLDCLNNDSQTEKNYQIPKNGDWITVEVQNDSVPFIRTPVDTEEQPSIEIKNEQGTEELTYYYYGDDEEQFFEKWKKNNHSYAVIENDRATFLIPIKDRELIVRKDGNNYNFKSIDEMLEYYHNFVEQFDRFLGLSYDTDNELNKNVKTKFFVKANKHGAGAAYYSGNHTAQNGDSISGYLSKGWLNLHEFGHGYEGSLANKDLALVDVMNNILAHYYQITFLNENDGGWLGKKLNIENNMKQARDKATNFNELSYQQKLYVFVDLLDKIGPQKSMAYVHSEYRKYVKNGMQYNASDMYAKGFSEVSGYNVIPYLNQSKIFPSEDIETEIYEKELPMLYYLRDLVSSDEKAEQIRKELNLEGNYSVVSNEDISKYNMKGNAVIKISIEDFEQIKGKKLYIKDGSKVIKEITVDNQTISIKDLPAGIYTIQLPSTKSEAYEHSYEYLVIQENANTEKNVQYEKINTNVLASDTKVRLTGLGNSEFANITMDMENKTIRVKGNNQQPHSYFTDEYSNIQILDENGNKIYEKSFIGNVNSPCDDTLNIQYGYKITLKHREPTRLVFQSQMLNEKEEYSNTTIEPTSYIITKYGLQKEGTSDEEQYQIYKRKIDKYITKIKSMIPDTKMKDGNTYFIQRNKLLSAILELNETDKTQYLEENKILLFGNVETPKDDNKDDSKNDVTKLTLTSEKYKINDKYIYRVQKETKYSDYIKNIKTNGKVTIFKEDGTVLKSEEFIGTGMKMTVELQNEKKEIKIAVAGDLDGNGKVTATDLSTLNKAILKTVTLEGEYKLAGDLDESGRITATDLSTINQMVLKII